MRTSRPTELVVFGMLLGTSIGFADGLMAVHAWLMLGGPDFYIRANWGEIPHIVLFTFSGTLAGILYGGFLVHISHGRPERLRLARIYCSSMIFAMPILFGMHYYVIAHRAPLVMIPFEPEITVFLLSVGLALYLGREKRPPQRREPSKATG